MDTTNDLRGLGIVCGSQGASVPVYPKNIDLTDVLDHHRDDRIPLDIHDRNPCDQYSNVLLFRNVDSANSTNMISSSIGSDLLGDRDKFSDSGYCGYSDNRSDLSSNNKADHAHSHLTTCYTCTAKANGARSLAFDMIRKGSVAEIRRFRPGSTLTYFVDHHGLSAIDFGLLKAGMATAAKEWNDCDIGVTFKEVTLENTASFKVVYHEPARNKYKYYAKAFFPGMTQLVKVGPLSFREDNRDFISNILQHELVHIPGGRHTNCETNEPYHPAYLYPTRKLDENSVMNTDNLPDLSRFVINDQDILDLQQFYKLPPGDHPHTRQHDLEPYTHFRIIDVDVEADARRGVQYRPGQ